MKEIKVGMEAVWTVGDEGIGEVFGIYYEKSRACDIVIGVRWEDGREMYYYGVDLKSGELVIQETPRSKTSIHKQGFDGLKHLIKGMRMRFDLAQGLIKEIEEKEDANNKG